MLNTTKQYTVEYSLYGNSKQLMETINEVQAAAVGLQRTMKGMTDSLQFSQSRKNSAFSSILKQYKQLANLKSEIKLPTLDLGGYETQLKAMEEMTAQSINRIKAQFNSISSAAAPLINAVNALAAAGNRGASVLTPQKTKGEAFRSYLKKAGVSDVERFLADMRQEGKAIRELANLKDQNDAALAKINNNKAEQKKLTRQAGLGGSPSRIAMLKEQIAGYEADNKALNDAIDERNAVMSNLRKGRGSVFGKYTPNEGPFASFKGYLKKFNKSIEETATSANTAIKGAPSGSSQVSGLEGLVNLAGRLKAIASERIALQLDANTTAANEKLLQTLEGIEAIQRVAKQPVTLNVKTTGLGKGKNGENKPKFNVLPQVSLKDLESAMKFSTLPKVKVMPTIVKSDLQSAINANEYTARVRVVQDNKSGNAASKIQGKPVNVRGRFLSGDLAKQISIDLHEIQDIVNKRPILIKARMLGGDLAKQISIDLHEIQDIVNRRPILIGGKFNAADFNKQVKAFKPTPLAVKMKLGWGTGKEGRAAQLKAITDGMKPLEMSVNLDTSAAKAKLQELRAIASSMSPLNIGTTAGGVGNRGTTQAAVQAQVQRATTASLRSTAKSGAKTAITPINVGRTKVAYDDPTGWPTRKGGLYTDLRKNLYPFTGNTSFGARTPMAIDMAKGMGMMFAVSGVMQAVSSSFTQVAEYENLMKTVQAILKTNDNSSNFAGRYKAMEDEIRRVGRETKFTAPEVAGAARFMAMAGLGIEDINAATNPIANLALVGDNDMSTTADKMTNIMTSFGLLKGLSTSQKSANMKHTSDVLTNTFTRSNTDLIQLAEAMQYAGPMSHLTGTSLEDAAAMVGIMGNAGIQSSMAGTTLRMMYQNIIKPNKKQAAEWDRLGIKRTDSQGRVRNIFDILQDLRAKITGTTDLNETVDADQLKIMGAEVMSLFRTTAGAGTAALLENLGEAINLANSNREANGVAQTIADQKKNTISGLWAQVTSTFTDQSVNTVSDFTDTIKDMLRDMRDWLASKEAAETLKSIYSMAKEVLEVIKWVAGIWKDIYSSAPGVINSFIKFQFVATQIGFLVTPFVQVAGAIATLKNGLVGLVGALSSASFATGVGRGLTGVAGTAGTMIGRMPMTGRTGATSVLAASVVNGMYRPTSSAPAGLVAANIVGGMRTIPNSVRKAMAAEAVAYRQANWPNNMSEYASYRDRLRSVNKMQRTFDPTAYNPLAIPYSTREGRYIYGTWAPTYKTSQQQINSMIGGLQNEMSGMLTKSGVVKPGMEKAYAEALDRMRSLQKISSGMRPGDYSILAASALNRFYGGDPSMPTARQARGQIESMARELGNKANALRPSNHLNIPKQYMAASVNNVMPFHQFANTSAAVLAGGAAQTQFADQYKDKGAKLQSLAYRLRAKGITTLPNGTPIDTNRLLHQSTIYRQAALDAGVVKSTISNTSVMNPNLYYGGLAAGQIASIRDARTAHTNSILQFARDRQATRIVSNDVLLRGMSGKGRGYGWAFKGAMQSGVAMGAWGGFDGIKRSIQSLGLYLAKGIGMLFSPVGLAVTSFATLGIAIWRVCQHVKEMNRQQEAAAVNYRKMSDALKQDNQNLVNMGNSIGGFNTVNGGYERDRSQVSNTVSLSEKDTSGIFNDTSTLKASDIVKNYVSLYSKYLPSGMVDNFLKSNPDYDLKAGEWGQTVADQNSLKNAQRLAVVAQWAKLATEQDDVQKAAKAILEAQSKGDTEKVKNILDQFKVPEYAKRMMSSKYDANQLSKIENADKYYEYMNAQLQYLKEIANKMDIPIQNYAKAMDLIKEGVENKTISKELPATLLRAQSISWRGNTGQLFLDKNNQVDWNKMARYYNDGILFTTKERVDLMNNIYDNIFNNDDLKNVPDMYRYVAQYLPYLANIKPSTPLTGDIATDSAWGRMITTERLKGQLRTEGGYGTDAYKVRRAKEVVQWIRSERGDVGQTLTKSEVQNLKNWLKNNGFDENGNPIVKQNNGKTHNGITPPSTDQSGYDSKYNRHQARPTQIIFNIDQLCKFEHTNVNSLEQKDIAESVGRQLAEGLQIMFAQAASDFAIVGETNG